MQLDGLALALTSAGASRSPTAAAAIRRHASPDTSTSPEHASPCTRAAVLTVSPIAVEECCSAVPALPTTATPVSSPMWNRGRSGRSAATSAAAARMPNPARAAQRMVSADRPAREDRDRRVTREPVDHAAGVPVTAGTTAAQYVLSMWIVSLTVRPSEKLVKPARSANSTEEQPPVPVPVRHHAGHDGEHDVGHGDHEHQPEV